MIACGYYLFSRRDILVGWEIHYINTPAHFAESSMILRSIALGN